MATDYHRGQNQAIPTEGENRPVITHGPPQGHYSADSGEWDGQLPHTEILQGTEPDYSGYPGPVARRQWATMLGINFNLSGGERAILQSYAHDAGTPRGCWKSAATMAHELGYNEDFIRDARKKLIQLGILTDQGRVNRAQKVTLNMNVTGPDTRLRQDQTGCDTRLARNVTGSDTGLREPVEQGKPGMRPGYEDVTGCDTASKPGVTPGKLKGTEKREREDLYNFSLIPGSNFSSPGVTPDYATAETAGQARKALTSDKQSESEPSDRAELRSESRRLSSTSAPDAGVEQQSMGQTPVRDSGVETPQASEPTIGTPAQGRTSDSVSGAPEQPPNPEHERIRALVVQNWPLIEKSGWQFLDAAVKHYRTHGITYLQRDLRIKRDNLEKAELATRTCAHCNTVHEGPDQLRPCVMCNEPKCVSHLSPCQRTGCQGKPNPRGRDGPTSRQRK